MKFVYCYSGSAAPIKEMALYVIDQKVFDIKILGYGAWPGPVGVVGRKIAFSVSVYFFVKGVKWNIENKEVMALFMASRNGR